MNDFSEIQILLEKLTKQAETTIESKTANELRKLIEDKQHFLDKKDHSIAFIGTVGIGKSSLLAVASNLFIGSEPKERGELKAYSILPIGAGRTSICETCIRSKQEGDQAELGLLIEPVSSDEMEMEIRSFAEDEWHKRQPDGQKGDTDPVAQEVRRVIRSMTGYSITQESYLDGDKQKKRPVDPLNEIIPKYDTHDAFIAHLLERAQLSQRNSLPSWWDVDSIENRQALKARFDAINQGKEPQTLLPNRITLVVPSLLKQTGEPFDLSLLDTRGLEVGGYIEAREDLQRCLRDPRSVIVLCASFNDAPGETIIAVICSMSADLELREAMSRVLLILVDQGNAEQVNGADGDREYGQELKIHECMIALKDVGISSIKESQIIAFDVLQDQQDRLLNILTDSVMVLREKIKYQLDEYIENARQFLININAAQRPELIKAVNDRIKDVMAEHLPSGFPLDDPLEGLYQAIRSERSRPSVIYATCRRKGIYERRGINLYEAIRNRARQAATSWLDNLKDEVDSELRKLESDLNYLVVKDHIDSLKWEFIESQIRVVYDYSSNVCSEVNNYLKADFSEQQSQHVWDSCWQEWGQGAGFVDRVIGHFANWSEQHQRVITAHEETNAEEHIPFWREASEQAPRFTLHVHNLRALRQSQWMPEPISVLIGANGAGKSTLFKVLKLLQKAYDQDLSTAINTVLGGSFHLRSWGSAEDEPIEVGLDFGTIRWRIQLSSQAGSVSILTIESLFEGEREVFSRDSLGVFMYGNQKIDSDKSIGLRTLMNRGSHDYAIRTVAKLLQNIAVYADFDLPSLRENGSNAFDDQILNSRGTNVLAVLRRWSAERVNQHRYDFVIEGLQAAFPYAFQSLDFVTAGNTIQANIYAPKQESPSPLAFEANGFLQLLILFCAVASTDKESVVAIDEPECGLHPYALRVFLRRVSRWAKMLDATILLATHSLVLLDELTEHPEQVFVIQPSDKPMPIRLDHFCNPEWLQDFKLGELYEDGEIGSNKDEIRL